MSETLIIDGYNLIRRAFDVEQFELEAQRDLLETRLREFLRVRPALHLVLVYDGAAGINITALRGRSVAVTKGLEVIYAEPPDIADDVVLRECRRRRQLGPVTVISSDRKDIISQLPRGPVRHRSSEEFAFLLNEALRERPRPASGGDETSSESAAPTGEAEEPESPEKPEGTSPEELEEWLDAFADAAQETDLAEPDPRSGAKTPCRQKDAGNSEKPGQLSEDEVREWLEVFEDPEAK